MWYTFVTGFCPAANTRTRFESHKCLFESFIFPLCSRRLVLCVLDKMRYKVTSSLVFFSVGLLSFLFLLDPKKYLHVQKKFVGIIIKKTMLDPYIEI